MNGDRAAKFVAVAFESDWLCVLRRVMRRNIASPTMPVAAIDLKSKKAVTPTSVQNGKSPSGPG